jgi:dihydrofolate reductase
MDRNRVIGREGDLPWRLPSDLKHFKRVTLGKPCLMGRKTWESLPFPLPGRPNLVLTRNADYTAEGAQVFTDMNAMIGKGYELAGAAGVNEIMLIGGAQLYETLLPRLDRLYITYVDAEVEGDAVFPEIDAAFWRLTRKERPQKGPKDEFSFHVAVFDRVSEG